MPSLIVSSLVILEGFVGQELEFVIDRNDPSCVYNMDQKRPLAPLYTGTERAPKVLSIRRIKKAKQSVILIVCCNATGTERASERSKRANMHYRKFFTDVAHTRSDFSPGDVPITSSWAWKQPLVRKVIATLTNLYKELIKGQL
ncbi:uncharacterized protein PHALS_03657 [Plasmopara halstedii]|uniref:Uncharacterized protein n=1 Tax=Plasmopara halstedii TaxID=4781 RepID=A0A0P1AZU8_PLAHL|nr:uncharacterized protein PHALS_03657 [Plasmopara halstedii]CEG46990.1 hypothetical protein PHALS_03657 [Plasmopara halstedii]|eukprot:XP_024583359.1 hypothetical protein PHALS_03657 [Plasmopara halstedii]